MAKLAARFEVCKMRHVHHHTLYNNIGQPLTTGLDPELGEVRAPGPDAAEAQGGWAPDPHVQPDDEGEQTRSSTHKNEKSGDTRGYLLETNREEINHLLSLSSLVALRSRDAQKGTWHGSG